MFRHLEVRDRDERSDDRRRGSGKEHQLRRRRRHPPAGISYEGYRTEVRWNASSLQDQFGNPLVSGNAYRLEFMVHDGDQNKTGGDAGEACVNVVIP